MKHSIQPQSEKECNCGKNAGVVHYVGCPFEATFESQDTSVWESELASIFLKSPQFEDTKYLFCLNQDIKHFISTLLQAQNDRILQWAKEENIHIEKSISDSQLSIDGMKNRMYDYGFNKALSLLESYLTGESK